MLSVCRYRSLKRQPGKTIGVNMTKQFKIFDWAGNDKSAYYGVFKTFEDAWDALYVEFGDLPEKEYEETLGEFQVLEVARE